jgi:hypothetical protein
MDGLRLKVEPAEAPVTAAEGEGRVP